MSIRTLCQLYLLTGWISLFVAIGNIRSQETTVAFAFVDNLQGKHSLTPGAAYKYQVANDVLQRLIRARGDFRQRAPAFVMNYGDRYVAWMDPSQHTIGLEEKAYDVCIAMGADSLNALAALLAHELVHYYEKHDWNVHFASHNADISTADTLRNIKDRLKHETQADYLGGFLAYTAGFPVHGIMPRLLEALYKGYDLPDQLRNYPSLKERVAMSQNGMKRLEELQIVFETANLLTMAGHHADAATYYQYILQEFPSREIYNNAGVNLVAAALTLFAPSEWKWALPLELDAHSRLYGKKSVDPARIALREKYIQQALQYFESAQLLDKQYVPVMINQASVLLLQGLADDASFLITKAKKVAQNEFVSDFIILEGIAKAVSGDLAGAQLLFEKAALAGSALAAINLDLIQGKTSSPSVQRHPGTDKIDQTQIDRFLANPVIDQEVNLGNGVYAYIKRLPNSIIYMHSADQNNRFAVFHICQNQCTDKTRLATGIGTPAEALDETHGPAMALNVSDSTYLYFSSQQLFYIVNTGGNVTGWGTLRTNQDL